MLSLGAHPDRPHRHPPVDAVAVAAGRYKARLAVRAGGLKRVRTFPVTVTEAPAPVPVVASTEGVFPVRGAYSFGGKDARFGAGRGDHVHQGQDVTAAEGTPLVSPVSGTVYLRKVQPRGAGHYLVIRGADGTDYVFMHLVAGSELVDQGDPVKRRPADRPGRQHRRLLRARTCTSRSGRTAGTRRAPSRSTRCPRSRPGPAPSRRGSLTLQAGS